MKAGERERRNKRANKHIKIVKKGIQKRKKKVLQRKKEKKL